MTTQTFITVIMGVIAQQMREDSRVLYMSTEPPTELIDEFGPVRVRRAPIAESAMVGMATGLAGSGYRPIVGLNNVAFHFVAFDQIINQTARIRYMSGGQRRFPMVLFSYYSNGTRTASQHSQTGFAYYAHAGGLKVVSPTTVADAAGLMQSAIRDDNPVVFLYPRRVDTEEEDVPAVIEPVQLGPARIERHGTDVTVVGVGTIAREARPAADALSADGISCEVIEIRTIVPLDMVAIRKSVLRTGRLIILDESFPTCSIAAEIAASIAEDGECLSALKAPIQRVCTAPVPVPFSGPLEDVVLPDRDDLIAAVKKTLDTPLAAARD